MTESLIHEHEHRLSTLLQGLSPVYFYEKATDAGSPWFAHRRTREAKLG